MSSENLVNAPEQLAEETTENAQMILQNAAMISEVSSQLKNETKICEKYLDYLNTLVFKAGKDVSSLHNCVDSLLLVAKKLVYMSLKMVPVSDTNFNNLKGEAKKLLTVLDEISENEDQLDEKLKNTYLKANLSTKCLNINEKYPEHCSKESLLDMNNIISLPTVPEGVFADFGRPCRTKSSTSLKNMRRVKMCLQKMTDDYIDQTSQNDCLTISDTSVS